MLRIFISKDIILILFNGAQNDLGWLWKAKNEFGNGLRDMEEYFLGCYDQQNTTYLRCVLWESMISYEKLMLKINENLIEY